VPVVAVAVAVRVAVAVGVRVAVAVEPVVAVAVARAVVAVAVARAVVAVAVAVAVVLHVPLFVHQLSVLGLNGELGGQSRLAAIGAIDVYFAPLYVTDAPVAYAVQYANAGTPEQLTCAEAVLADTMASKHRLTTTNSLVFIRNPFEIKATHSGHCLKASAPQECGEPLSPSPICDFFCAEKLGTVVRPPGCFVNEFSL
jgi:hypothetical protein